MKDIKETGSLGEETAKSTVIVGSRWIGPTVGAFAGQKIGSVVGMASHFII